MPNWVRIISVAVFAASFVLGMGLVSWYEIWEVPNDTALATLIAIVVKGEAVAVVSAAFAGVIEGGAYIVVIASYLVQKSRREGRAEGRAEAYADARRQLAAYYKRMQEARERGEEFNEPPPTFREDQGED